MKNTRWLVGFTFLLLAVAPALRAQLLYDITFDSANYLGSAPSGVSAIEFGNPVVVPSLGGLTNQPLELNMTGNSPPFFYDQIQINLPPVQGPVIRVSFDFTSVGLIGSTGAFVVLVDDPSSNNLSFLNNGHIVLQNQLLANQTVGSFTDGETFNVALQINVAQRLFSAYEDNVFLGQATMFSGDYVHDIRFSYGLLVSSNTSSTGAAGIDNITISSIPEPGSAAEIFGAGCLMVFCWRRKRCIAA